MPGDTNGYFDIFVRDRGASTTTRISLGAGGQGNGDSLDASISPSGLLVAFDSLAFNLVPGDTNGKQDVFLWQRVERIPFLGCQRNRQQRPLATNRAPLRGAESRRCGSLAWAESHQPGFTQRRSQAPGDQHLSPHSPGNPRLQFQDCEHR